MAKTKNVDLTKRTCLVTGATNGIGRATARGLAEMGASVFLVARNPERAEQTVSEIATQTGNSKLTVLMGDLGKLSDVRRIAAEFLATDSPLHILVNNAAVVNTKRKLTEDGFEEMFAVNYLSHFLLTNLLLERIKASAPARIVHVASGGHALCRGIQFDDLSAETWFATFKTYGHSKLANMLFSRELARRLDGSGVTSNSLHPGAVSTGLGTQNAWYGKLAVALLRPFFRSPAKGAATSLHVATAPELADVSGKYFANCRETPPKPWALDDETATQLWNVSSDLVNPST